MVGTSKLIGGTRSRHLRGAVVLVTVIQTVIVPVAAPSDRHTVLIGTGECRRGASGIVNSTVHFVTVVMAVVNTVASVAVWDTFAVATGEGVGSALQCGGLVGRVLHTCLLVWRQLHAIRAATHPLGVWGREAEVAAVSVRVGLPVAEVGTNLGVGVERLDMHDVADSSSDNDHLPTISLAHAHNPTQAPVSEIGIAFKNGETKRMGDLSYAVQ